MPKNNILLSIIIVSYNTKEITLNCLRSIYSDKQLDITGRHTPTHPENHTFPTEIIVVDNNSTDGSVEALEKEVLTLIKNKTNTGFGIANNQGLKIAKGEYILLLNSDTLIHESAISQCLIWLSTHPEAASCTGCLQNPDGSLQPTGGYFPNLLNLFTWTFQLDDLPFVNKFIPPLHPHSPSFYTKEATYSSDNNLDWLMGAFVLTRREILTEVGGFDQSIFMYAEDIDLFYRIHKKYPKLINRYLSTPKITHIGGASSLNSSNRIYLEYKGLISFFSKHKPAQKLIAQLIISYNSLVRRFFYTVIGKKHTADLYSKV